MRRWTLARRATALVAVGALAMLAAIVALLVLNQRSQAATTDAVERLGPAREQAAGLLTTLVEEQNSVRGYALTGDHSGLTSYQALVNVEGRELGNLRTLLGSDAELDRRLRGVDAAAADWRARGAGPLIDVVTASGPRPAGDATYQAEERLFGPARDGARDLLGALETRRIAAIEALDGYRRAELIALSVGIAVVLAVAVASLLLLRRWVIDPIERLAEDARQVAGGAHDHRVRVPAGPPELAATAADVERMRSKIVAELAELEASQRELQQTQEQLRNQAVDLMRSNRDLEQFAYVASHDLQEPLRKVSGFCQLLRRRYGGQLDERADQYINFAVDGAQRMQQLINDLLLFSRAGRGGRPLTEVSLAEVTEQAIRELSHSGPDGPAGTEVAGESGEDGLAPRFEVGELPTVRGDATLLRQLMANLLGNAVKFHRPGVPPEVRVSAERTDQGWEISVADNGIGVDPEFADKIFVIFQRLHGRDSYRGTGIGLALAKRIVEYHGGRIWLDTARRDGATIRFSLPVPPSPASQESADD